LLPRPLGSLPTLSTGHPRLALALAVAGLSTLVPAFALLAPASHWGQEAVFVLLLLFSFYAYVAAAHLRDTTSLDATFVAALLGVVLIGPLAGALVFAAPELTRLANDRRLTSMLANLASFGWASLAAAWTLQALGYGSPAELGAPGSYAAVAIAGLALILVNYFYMTVITGPVKAGIGLWFLTRRELIPTIPVDVHMIAAAAATAFLYSEVGIVGLLPLVGVVFLPRLLVPMLLRDIPIRDLTVSEATARYAGGLAEVLGLSSSQRRVLGDAATHLDGRARLTRLDDFGAVMRTVLYSHECWAGGGRLGLVSGDRIPIESRVLAVAHAWAVLTAQGGPGLTPKEALVNLRARAGQELDSVVVAAAVNTVHNNIIELGGPGARPAPAVIANAS
jgi:HD domain-containing protein